MCPTIDIDDDVFNLLRDNAEPFVDTPNMVARRLLGLEAAQRTNGASPAPRSTTRAASPASASATPSRSKPKAPSGKRAARGTLLAESEYEMPILRYLIEHEGSAPSREVVDALGAELSERLTAADHETLRSGDVRWRSRAAFVRLRLIEKGDLDGQAPRGTWRITPQGRDRVGEDS